MRRRWCCGASIARPAPIVAHSNCRRSGGCFHACPSTSQEQARQGEVRRPSGHSRPPLRDVRGLATWRKTKCCQRLQRSLGRRTALAVAHRAVAMWVLPGPPTGTTSITDAALGRGRFSVPLRDKAQKLPRDQAHVSTRGSAGSVTHTRQPPCGKFPRVTVPPCASTADLTMAKPSPVPPAEGLRAASSR